MENNEPSHENNSIEESVDIEPGTSQSDPRAAEKVGEDDGSFIIRWDEVDNEVQEILEEISRPGEATSEAALAITRQAVKQAIESNLRETMTVKDWYEKWDGWDKVHKNPDGTLNHEIYDRDHATRLVDWKAAIQNTIRSADKSGKKGEAWRQVLKENGIVLNGDSIIRKEEEPQTGQAATEDERLSRDIGEALSNGGFVQVEEELMQKFAESSLPGADMARKAYAYANDDIE